MATVSAGFSVSRILASGLLKQGQKEDQPMPVKTTMLELVTALSEEADSVDEVIATATWMLRSGSVELCGSFRDQPLADILAAA